MVTIKELIEIRYQFDANKFEDAIERISKLDNLLHVGKFACNELDRMRSEEEAFDDRVQMESEKLKKLKWSTPEYKEVRTKFEELKIQYYSWWGHRWIRELEEIVNDVKKDMNQISGNSPVK